MSEAIGKLLTKVGKLLTKVGKLLTKVGVYTLTVFLSTVYYILLPVLLPIFMVNALDKPELRYQHAPWYTRYYRQIRYKPKWFFISCWVIVRWAFQGMPVDAKGETPDGRPIRWPSCTRWGMVKTLWSIHRGLCDLDMQHYYRCSEVIDKLREGRKSIELSERLNTEEPEDWDDEDFS